MALPNLNLVKGTSRDFVMQAVCADNSIPTTLLGSDTLTATLWQGDDQSSTLTPTVTWVDATTAKYQITFNNSDTSSLSPGVYRLQAFATRSSRTVTLLDATLTLLATAGSASALTTYCSIEDMRRIASWIERLQTKDDQTGFAEQRHMAREWTDTCIQKHFRGTNTVSSDFYFTPWTFGGPAGLWSRPWRPYRTGAWNTTLQTWLDANYLILRAPIVRANALYALAIVCESQLTAEYANPYHEQGKRFRRLANAAITSCEAEIDTDADGLANYTIRMSIVDQLEA